MKTKETKKDFKDSKNNNKDPKERQSAYEVAQEKTTERKPQQRHKKCSQRNSK